MDMGEPVERSRAPLRRCMCTAHGRAPRVGRNGRVRCRHHPHAVLRFTRHAASPMTALQPWGTRLAASVRAPHRRCCLDSTLRTRTLSLQHASLVDVSPSRSSAPVGVSAGPSALARVTSQSKPQRVAARRKVSRVLTRDAALRLNKGRFNRESATSPAAR